MAKKSDGQIFCRNVAYLRRLHGLSYSEMARKLHIGVCTLKKLEQGIVPKNMHFNIIIHIYTNFGIMPSQQLETLLEEKTQ